MHSIQPVTPVHYNPAGIPLDIIVFLLYISYVPQIPNFRLSNQHLIGKLEGQLAEKSEVFGMQVKVVYAVTPHTNYAVPSAASAVTYPQQGLV
jgi:hypothetical protein